MDRPLRSSTSPNLMTSLKETEPTAMISQAVWTLKKKKKFSLFQRNITHLGLFYCIYIYTGLMTKGPQPPAGLWTCDTQVAKLTGVHTWLCPVGIQTGWCQQVSQEKRLAPSGPAVSAFHSGGTVSWLGTGHTAPRWTAPGDSGLIHWKACCWQP